MAEYRSAEAQKVIQRLLKQLEEQQTLQQISDNAAKKVKRGLGALLFSPDYLGYVDVIDDLMSKGKKPKQILSSIATRSANLVKSYSPLPGVFEAHHIIALNSLRDSFLKLPPDQQDLFLKKLSDLGWELGDSPQQLVNTVLTRQAHVGQASKDPLAGEEGTIIGETKTEFKENVKPVPDHAHRKRIVAGPAATADELLEQFNNNIAPEQIKLARQGLLNDNKFRAFMATKGYSLDKITPEIVNEYLNDPLKARGLLKSIAEGASEYEPTTPETSSQLVDEFGQPLTADPNYIGQFGSFLQIKRLDGTVDPAQAIKIQQAWNQMLSGSQNVYSLDPVGAGLQGARNLVKGGQLGPGAILGAVQDPELVDLAFDAAEEGNLEKGAVAGGAFTGNLVAGMAVDQLTNKLPAVGGKLLGAANLPLYFIEGREGSALDRLFNRGGKYIGMNQTRPSWGMDSRIITEKPAHIQAVEEGLNWAGDRVGDLFNSSVEALKNMDLSGFKGPFPGLKREAQEELPQPIGDVDGQVYNPLAPSI